jgi:hypothetical protein
MRGSVPTPERRDATRANKARNSFVTVPLRSELPSRGVRSEAARSPTSSRTVGKLDIACGRSVVE